MIYVGAIAVLFLFVVMMIDLKKTQLVNQYSQFSSLFAATVVVFLLIASYSYNECTAFFSSTDSSSLYFQFIQNLDDFSSFYCVANYIYSFGVY
jgi:NADH:ubiquinone oxidoreductase subunit 6 (subunit J)